MHSSSTHITAQNDPMIYICATMWHEAESEMVEMLKSFFRLDIDQMMQQQAHHKSSMKNPKYYEFEANIFFDDAMTPHSECDENYDINTFVTTFVKAVDKAASAIQKKPIALAPPRKCSTPYGGRLEWTMPGNNKIVVHLKDKTKIRNKKRWSQVMSMYYHLVYHMSPETGSKLQADRTFLLHVDGDVDFKPESVHILIDMMNKDEQLGAVCGRTNPRGNGPVVWTQKFEYALSHWFQKATEDALGCVLCCPGCFSLLRGSAVIDVLERFTEPPSKAKHYLLENQGEDRWFCSLLIRQGWRVKYSATSMCWTMAPTTLDELYKQRRRWTPSGFFHNLDLLTNSRKFLKKNDRMHITYIAYQAFIFLISLLAGSLILLVLSRAVQFVSHGKLDLPWALLLNLLPVIIMGVLGIVASSNIQIMIARVLTVVYALLQVFLMAFALYTAYMGEICSPPAIFLLVSGGTILLAGLLHPREFFNVLCALPYYFFAPSMYLFMMIYALSNLHVISWGTREQKTPKPSPKPDDSDLSKDNRKENDGIPPNKLKWITNGDLGDGPIDHLPDNEQEFLMSLIENHLQPLATEKSQAEEVKSELKQLRNKTVFFYYMLNMVFLTTVIILENFHSKMTLQWPCPTSPAIQPFGLITIAMLGFGLSLQLAGMLIHRLISLKREISRHCYPHQPKRPREESIEEGTLGVYNHGSVTWLASPSFINYGYLQSPCTLENESKDHCTKL